MQRPAKPWTPVRFRPQPPILVETEKLYDLFIHQYHAQVVELVDDVQDALMSRWTGCPKATTRDHIQEIHK